MAFDSLFTGVTGLNAYQSWIDMISNNIANVDTTGFKGQRMTFADLFYQSQSFGSAPTNSSGGVDGQQLGLGVKVNTVDTEFAQGGLQTTGINTDLAVNGNGFFIERSPDGNSSPVYTRDGAFSLNENGLLYDPGSGLAVQGWEANSDGQVTASGQVGNITIPLGLSEQATATGAGNKVGPNSADNVFDVALGGNLDQTQWQQAFQHSVGASATAGTPFTVTTTVYDSLGNAHEATITYIPVTAGAVAATVPGGAPTTNGTTNGGLSNVITGPITVAGGTSNNDTIKVTIEGNGTACVTDQNTGAVLDSGVGSGGTVTAADGASFALGSFSAADNGKSATFSVVSAQNGLPSVVQNAAGKSVEPATRWEVNMSFTDGTQFSTITNPGTEVNGVVTAPTFANASSGTVGFAYFDQNGQFINTSTIETATGAAGIGGANATAFIHTTGVDPSIDQGNELDVTQWGVGVGNNASAPTGQAPNPGAIGLDFSNQASLAGTYSASVVSQNGFQAGTLDNITIGQDGSVTGSFTNGQEKTLAQVALATFQNEDGLTRLGSNQFSATANSGLAQVGVAASGNFGAIQSGALEQSNVSLATEFTNLIIAQRAFEANTRGITTADQNLQTIIDLRASEN
jgi:flagellar hook protein FlgE